MNSLFSSPTFRMKGWLITHGRNCWAFLRGTV